MFATHSGGGETHAQVHAQQHAPGHQYVPVAPTPPPVYYHPEPAHHPVISHVLAQHAQNMAHHVAHHAAVHHVAPHLPHNPMHSPLAHVFAQALAQLATQGGQGGASPEAPYGYVMGPHGLVPAPAPPPGSPMAQQMQGGPAMPQQGDPYAGNNSIVHPGGDSGGGSNGILSWLGIG